MICHCQPESMQAGIDPVSHQKQDLYCPHSAGPCTPKASYVGGARRRTAPMREQLPLGQVKLFEEDLQSDNEGVAKRLGDLQDLQAKPQRIPHRRPNQEEGSAFTKVLLELKAL